MARRMMVEEVYIRKKACLSNFERVSMLLSWNEIVIGYSHRSNLIRIHSEFVLHFKYTLFVQKTFQKNEIRFLFVISPYRKRRDIFFFLSLSKISPRRERRFFNVSLSFIFEGRKGLNICSRSNKVIARARWQTGSVVIADAQS